MMIDSTPYEPVPSTSKLPLTSSSTTSSLSASPSSSSSTKKLISSISTLPQSQLDTDTCSLLGPFSILIQAIMAIIIFASLLYKRHREKPKRKYRIWTADVSKQVLGQAFVHMLNIFISDSMAGLPSKGNPCALYFMNIFIDTTIGVFILFLALNSLTKLVCRVLRKSPASLGLSSGIYPRPFLMSWIKQISIYFVGLLILKLFVIGLFWLGGQALIKFGDGIIESISHDPKVQILMVVMVGPTILNVLQFLLIDSFIKHKPTHHLDQLESDDGRRFLNADDSDAESDDQDHQDEDDDDDHGNDRNKSGLPTNGDQDRIVRKKKDHQNLNSNRHQRSRLSNPTNLHGPLSSIVADVPHSYPPKTPQHQQSQTRERNQQNSHRFDGPHPSLEESRRRFQPSSSSANHHLHVTSLHSNDKFVRLGVLQNPSNQPSVQHPIIIKSTSPSESNKLTKQAEGAPIFIHKENGSRGLIPINLSSQTNHLKPKLKMKNSNLSHLPPHHTSIFIHPSATRHHYHHHCSSPTELRTGFSVLDLEPSTITNTPTPPKNNQHHHYHHILNPFVC